MEIGEGEGAHDAQVINYTPGSIKHTKTTFVSSSSKIKIFIE